MIRMMLAAALLLMSVKGGELVFGVVPQQSPQKLYESWVPFLEELSRQTGLNIVFKTEKSIEAFEKKLYSGEYDLAYANPYHFVVAHHEKGYIPLVRADKMLTGILVAAKSSGLKTPADMKQETVLFPSPNAFAATLINRYEMHKDFGFTITDREAMFVNSHDSVYKGVARGVARVGGGVMRTFLLMDAQVRDQLQIIHKTKPYPSHPVLVHPSVAQLDRQAIEKVLLGMQKNDLERIGASRMIPVTTEDYAPVDQMARTIGLYPYESAQ